MHIRILAAILLLLIAAPAAAAASNPRLHAIVGEFMKREKVSGVAVVALRRDEPIFEVSYGEGRVMGVQPYYSASKQMTAALILKLAEQGKVDLEAPVGRYLPRWFADEPSLKVRHLLRHTSGLAEFTGSREAARISAARRGTGSLAAMMPLIDRQPRRFLPGERHAYSNSNYTILAVIAERVGGAGFDALQRRLLFEPLGLGIGSCAGMDRRTLGPGFNPDGSPFSWPANSHPAYDGNGGNCGTVHDLARWTRALGAGRAVGAPLLGGMRSGVPVRAGYVPPYGFGLSNKPLAGRRALWHSGIDEGWSAFAAYLPDEELSLAIVFNRGFVWPTELAVPLLRELLGTPAPADLERLPLSLEERAALGGAFEDGLFDIDIAAEEDRILVSVSAFPEPIEMWRQADGRFVAATRPDTFALRLAPHGPELDWAEHRSYLVRRR